MSGKNQERHVLGVEINVCVCDKIILSIGINQIITRNKQKYDIIRCVVDMYTFIS